VGVEVVDRAVNGRHCHLHAADGAFAAWSNHVVAVGRRAVADDFGVDFGATSQSVFQLFNHDHATTTGDDEAITVFVVGTGRFFRRVVVLSGQRAHGVEQERLAPVFFFAAASKHDVLLTQLDLLNRSTDAMCTGSAG